MAVVLRLAEVVAGIPPTRPLRCWAKEPIKKKFAKIAASARQLVKRVPSCRKNSAAGSINTSIV